MGEAEDDGAVFGRGMGAEREPVHAPRDLHEEIDDLSRELTDEIEAHRVTRERADAAEARLAELLRDIRQWAAGTDDATIYYVENILRDYEAKP